MKGKLPIQEQKNLFRPILMDIINPKHELVLITPKIDWKKIEHEFEPLYSHTGKPGVPIRTMVGLLILKRIHNLGDESMMEQWLQNPYFQYFCGESEFQWKYRCDPSELSSFRKRIGTKGAELILKMAEDFFNYKTNAKKLITETIVEEQQISYPAYYKVLNTVKNLYKSVVKKSWN